MKTQPVIFKDPVYGFISINPDIVFTLIEHPYFQRLRRIYQLGQTHIVYPGAVHTRFQHALGTVHLMKQAIDVLRMKGYNISSEEETASSIAILLHDIGHGPFSHTLERIIIEEHSHEDLTLYFLNLLNKQHNGALDMAIQIFQNKYDKPFLHQLVNSQLDVDRLDYLNRDSFYTGVQEGVIGSERIIKVLEIHNDELVIEEKGIYSVENFIISRRLMYWQVYLHKTVISAEQLVIKIIERAKYLLRNGTELPMPKALHYFLSKTGDKDLKEMTPESLDLYAQLDDYMIYTTAKDWGNSKDPVLAQLCDRMINRNLLGVRVQSEVIPDNELSELRKRTMDEYGWNEEDVKYIVFSDMAFNNAYDPTDTRINILSKNGSVKDIAEASDQLNISVLSKPVKKYYICYPKKMGK